jgi:hypothetical protein
VFSDFQFPHCRSKLFFEDAPVDCMTARVVKVHRFLVQKNACFEAVHVGRVDEGFCPEYKSEINCGHEFTSCPSIGKHHYRRRPEPWLSAKT